METNEHVHKSHNVSLLLYHLVCPMKYRRKVLNEITEQTLKNTCIEIGERFEIRFVEIGADEDHAHFLIQTVPNMTPSNMVRMINSITAKELFRQHPEIKKMLWGGNFWTSGFYINTVGQYASATVIQNYVKNQGRKYRKIYKSQLTLFDNP